MTAKKILYVDDESDIREVAQMSLELDPGFDVRVCASGTGALAEVAQWQPDIVLLDVMMPEMDGPETLQYLQSNPSTSHIVVVFITARTQTHEVEHYKSLGAAGVIAKPFDPMSLAEKVRSFISP
jgi:CheY-like chemotaxis protein